MAASAFACGGTVVGFSEQGSAGAAGSTGSTPSASPTAQPVETEPDVAPQVGQLHWSSASGDQASCTGTLVAPKLVLSARHCAYDGAGRSRADAGKWSFTLSASADPSTWQDSVAVSDIWMAPIVWTHDTQDWAPPFGTPDLALFQLATAIDSVAPLTIGLAKVQADEPPFLAVGYASSSATPATLTRHSAPTTLGELRGQPNHGKHATLAAFRAALGSALQVNEASFSAAQDERIQQWYDLTLAEEYEAYFQAAPSGGARCPTNAGSPLLRAGSDGKLQVFGVREHGLGLEPASRLCDFGSVYALFDSPAARDFLQLFGLIGQATPDSAAQAACARCNGDWGVHGLAPTPGCNCRTNDAGRSCFAREQCQGACLLDTRVPAGPASVVVVDPGPPRLGHFVGQCAEFVTSYGCRATAPVAEELLNLDEAPPMICTD